MKISMLSSLRPAALKVLEEGVRVSPSIWQTLAGQFAARPEQYQRALETSEPQRRADRNAAAFDRARVRYRLSP